MTIAQGGFYSSHLSVSFTPVWKVYNVFPVELLAFLSICPLLTRLEILVREAVANEPPEEGPEGGHKIHEIL